jgi:hypothetical protein
MAVVRPGTIGLAPEGLEYRGRRAATAFLLRDAKPKAAEKSWRRTLREDDRGEAGLRSDLSIRGRVGAPVMENQGNTAMAAVGLRAKDGGGWTELLGQDPDPQRRDMAIVARWERAGAAPTILPLRVSRTELPNRIVRVVLSDLPRHADDPSFPVLNDAAESRPRAMKGNLMVPP